jgi:hypothetical protein
MVEIPEYILRDALCEAGVDMDTFANGLEWYSGRGIYGRECFGFTWNLITFGAFLISMAVRYNIDDSASAWYLADAVCTDAMGTETVYYWPNLEVTK